MALEPVQRLDLTHRVHFDAAVVEVLHGAADAFASRKVVGEIPEADALHAPAHDVSAPEEHQPLIIAGLMGKWR